MAIITMEQKQAMQAKRLANYREEKEVLSVNSFDTDLHIVTNHSNSQIYEVENFAGAWNCECQDFKYRCKDAGIYCKHILAVFAKIGKPLPVVQVEVEPSPSILIRKYGKTASTVTATEYIHRSVGSKKGWETRKRNEARKQAEAQMTPEEKIQATINRW